MTYVLKEQNLCLISRVQKQILIKLWPFSIIEQLKNSTNYPGTKFVLYSVIFLGEQNLIYLFIYKADCAIGTFAVLSDKCQWLFLPT